MPKKIDKKFQEELTAEINNMLSSKAPSETEKVWAENISNIAIGVFIRAYNKLINDEYLEN